MAKRGITLAMVMSHMQHGFSLLKQEIREVDRKLSNRIDGIEKKMDTEFARIWNRFDLVDMGLDNINKRLHNSELASLPKRVRALEAKVGIR